MPHRKGKERIKPVNTAPREPGTAAGKKKMKKAKEKAGKCVRLPLGSSTSSSASKHEDDAPYYWVCPCDKRKGFSRSVFNGSMFSNMTAPSLFIDFAWFYLNGMDMKKIAEVLKLGLSRASEWKEKIQELCNEMLAHINIQLGGDAKTVEIDGTYLGGSTAQKTG